MRKGMRTFFGICSSRRIIVVLLVLASGLAAGTVAEAQKSVFFNGSWAEALNAARKAGKLVYLDAYTEWCGWCKEMDKRTFSDTLVGSFLKEHFIPIALDMEEGDGMRLAMKYRVASFPTSLIFDAEGKLLARFPGYMKPEHFLPMLREHLTPARQLHLEGVSAELDLDYPDFYRINFSKDTNRTWPSDSTVGVWLAAYPDWSEEIAWSVLWRFGGGPAGDTYVISNRAMLARRFGDDEIEDVLSSILWKRRQSAAERRSRAGLDSAFALAEELFPGRDAQSRWWQLADYFKATREWTRLAEIVNSYMDTVRTLACSGINDYSWTMYEEDADTAALADAASWMRRVTDEKPEWAYVDTYAAVLYKLGRRADAEREAIRAIEIGAKEGRNTSSTKELLVKIRLKKKK